MPKESTSSIGNGHVTIPVADYRALDSGNKQKLKDVPLYAGQILDK